MFLLTSYYYVLTNYFQRAEAQACIQYPAVYGLVEDEEEAGSHELWPHTADNSCYSGDASLYNFYKLYVAKQMIFCKNTKVISIYTANAVN